MPGIEIGENMPVRVVSIVDGDFKLLTYLIVILFRLEEVIFVLNCFTDLSTVWFEDFDLADH
jgi:hypothetical protein